MRQAIYPDLSRLWAHRDDSRFRRLFREPALLMGALGAAGWVAFGLLGKPILRLTVGPPYVAAYGVTLVYFTGVVISMGTFHFQSVLMAMGRPQDVFKSMLGATSIYFVLLAGLTATLGLFGAALAYGIFEAIWGGWMGARIRRAFPRGNGTPLTPLGETPEGPPATPTEIPSDLERAAS
jgi:O-antigen/teichoic acid export membrane protein